MNKEQKWITGISLFVIGIIAGLILSARFNITGVLHSEDTTNISSSATVPLVNPDGYSPFTKVAKLAMPAVVNISTEHIIKQQGGEFQLPFDEFFKKFFGDQIPQFKIPEREFKERSLGSGFIFRKDGKYYYILTNNHVVRNADKIIVKLSDKKILKGDKVKLVGADPRTDVAVLKIEYSGDLPVLRLGNSDSIQVGDWAIAIGNPFGLDRTLTVGVISAKGRSGIPLPQGPDYQDFIQTDAAINPGNSGGPLLNIKGEVIGINTAITSPSGGFVGIGFALPINTAKWVAKQLIAHGKVQRGYMGIRPQPVDENLAKAYGLKKPYGVLVAEVLDGTPAQKAGLKEGDIILSYNGKKVTDLQEFRIMVAETPPGTRVTLKVKSPNGKIRKITMKLTEYPEKESMAKGEKSEEEEVEPGKAKWAGLVVVDARSDMAKAMGLSQEEGVVIIKVSPNSPADDAGFRKGDVIVKVGEIEVKGLLSFKRAVKKYKHSNKPIIVKILRNQMPMFLGFNPKGD